jgi:hypothetical protein
MWLSGPPPYRGNGAGRDTGALGPPVLCRRSPALKCVRSAGCTVVHVRRPGRRAASRGTLRAAGSRLVTAQAGSQRSAVRPQRGKASACWGFGSACSTTSSRSAFVRASCWTTPEGYAPTPARAGLQGGGSLGEPAAEAEEAEARDFGNDPEALLGRPRQEVSKFCDLLRGQLDLSSRVPLPARGNRKRSRASAARALLGCP